MDIRDENIFLGANSFRCEKRHWGQELKLRNRQNYFNLKEKLCLYIVSPFTERFRHNDYLIPSAS